MSAETKMMSNISVHAFIDWFIKEQIHIARLPPEEIANRIADAVARVDSRLGVEVACSPDGSREVIITAYSNRELFGLVHEIVAQMPDVNGWVFITLKPPRGFAFAISIAGERVSAKGIRFRQIPDIPSGIALVVGDDVFASLPPEDDRRELGWLIAETGLGEELSSRLTHIEFTNSSGANDTQPISDLADFVGSLPSSNQGGQPEGEAE